MTIVDRIFEHFGTKKSLAKRLGCNPQAITRWTTEGVPAKAAIQIEKLTDGKFKAIDIPLRGQLTDTEAA